MTEPHVPRCACGGAELEAGPKRIILPCAGVASVGLLTTLAAVQLTDEGYGTAVCVALLATRSPGLMKSLHEADEIVVLDGCPVRCAARIAALQGIMPDQHVVVTTLGIEKRPAMEFSDEDLETVVSSVWEGKGREPDSDSVSGKGGCGCGGGCC